MSKWRLLDTGVRTAAENMAMDETLLETKSKKLSPNTVRFLQFYPPAVLVGYHQTVEQEVRLDFCNKNGIDVNRRITGGGAIYFDESQLGWEIICEKSFFKTSIVNESFFKDLCQPVIYALKRLGINAKFRPRNDIEVNGRKISGTGGTEEGEAFLFQGTLLVDFDVNTMLRALRIPIEKLKDKEIDSVKERVTCLKWELGCPHSGTVSIRGQSPIKQILKQGFEKEFGIELIKGGLTKDEELLFYQKLNKFKSNKWINKVKEPAYTRQVAHSVYKAEGGLIRTSLVVNTKRNQIESALITGDFFAYPKRAIFDLEAILKDIRADKITVQNKINQFFKGTRHGVSLPKIPGIKPSDFISAINEALEKIELVKFGIPLPLGNRVFTVNGTFSKIILQHVGAIHELPLLLPYCAKLKVCKFRYKDFCTECGKCSVGEAYRIGRERSMMVTTIVSFEHLMSTLKRYKRDGITSYIGCCCEPFYAKHREELEDIGLGGILIDIDNTTCYELGKVEEAYKGRFESQTELNIGLLKEVMDAIQ
ncbi:MAG: DUF116 domain-containing protein [bacterium]|nr:DUF116 domain-containing protein [bacterium]